ncbi:hydrolase [Corynebacterium godavarianum]|uniref:Hydrolase n=2 Tax=Corynebacterium TaxID=1716 RepID=A0A269PGR2_9CORY|nr:MULTISPECIES: GDSL-type esterase/lipase family protein [Corynebacterium]MBL7284975.1 hydrolase [Corynebacterium godavarianum]PAJ71260.1 hydrolase [Corynebacterium hadale]PAT09613.1 hydrolase [Corynebacterium hadale]TSJ74822.1 hydrolase [Corynebacterium godavarianum]TVX78365.1 hydrolase [Corynebacterium sp. NML180780]
MTRTSLRTKVAATCAAVLATIGSVGVAGTAVAPAAQAQERNLVILGDSVIADPSGPQWAAGKLGLDPRGSSSVTTWCPTSPTSWGKQAAGRLGLPAWDYSCTGTVSIQKGPQFASQVTRAVNEGGLTPSTARVIISTGFNDTYHNDGRDRAAFRRDFVAAMVPQINRIRAAAPNARIQIVGYPKITQGDRVCLFHVAPNVSDYTPFAAVQEWEDSAQWAQVDLARATGVEFLDMKPSTWNNNMCSPDNQRMWAGLVDFYGGPGNLPIHVNQRGHAHVAARIAAS